MCYTFIGIYVNGRKNNREKWNKKQGKKEEEQRRGK